MQQAITALGKNGFAGIYAANDDTGGGAIAAMKGAGINPEESPVTGQDATVAALQRILAGQQYMTIYKAIDAAGRRSPPKSRSRLAEGEEVPQDKVTEEIDNGKTEVPRCCWNRSPVTKDNIKDTVITDEFVSRDELCTGAYAAACKEAGISGLIEMSRGRLRSSSWRGSASDSARSRLWTGSTSPSAPARWSAWSATTAPASRRW